MIALQTRTLACRLSRIPCVAKTQHKRYHGPGYRSLVDYRPMRLSKVTLSCCASSEDREGGASPPGTAQEGDVVTVHWACMNEQGEVVETSRTADEPTTFQVGAGDIVGNQLFEAFDEAVRGMSVGETIGIKADGGEWKEELLFKVPMDHPEIQRMANRYKSQGGVHEGLIAELSNGGLALVVECTDDVVTLDANSMMAGKTLLFEIELLNIEKDNRM